MQLLKKLCEIHSPSGEEYKMREFILDYLEQNKSKFKIQPQIFSGEEFQDQIILKFGTPKTAVYSHIDTTGYTVRYKNELIEIGSPNAMENTKLRGFDSFGEIECTLQYSDNKDINQLYYKFSREIDCGTSLTFSPNFIEKNGFVQSPYLDNRVGIWSALKLAETIENGIIAFTTYEEHRGGGVEFLASFIYEMFKVKQALILDVTWVTNGVFHGNGVVISIRDSGIPRRKFVDKIINIAKENIIKFQLEVEKHGGSDGTAIQKLPFPIDWCFIGPPEDFVHSPNEIVQITDIQETLKFYEILLKKL